MTQNFCVQHYQSPEKMYIETKLRFIPYSAGWLKFKKQKIPRDNKCVEHWNTYTLRTPFEKCLALYARSNICIPII